jgi:hypothetical protein
MIIQRENIRRMGIQFQLAESFQGWNHRKRSFIRTEMLMGLFIFEKSETRPLPNCRRGDETGTTLLSIRKDFDSRKHTEKNVPEHEDTNQQIASIRPSCLRIQFTSELR